MNTYTPQKQSLSSEVYKMYGLMRERNIYKLWSERYLKGCGRLTHLLNSGKNEAAMRREARE